MDELKSYFANQRILIADDTTATRIAIARCLSALGANASQMSLTTSYEWALELASQQKFSILVCEYRLGDRCGLDLLEVMPQLKLSVIVTRDQTSEAAARAAEANVDVFLTKPFSVEGFKRALLRVISPEQETGAAVVALGSAQPALQRSIGQVKEMQAATRDYDKTGYRALTDLHASLLAEGKKEEAYIVLRKLLKSYPRNTERLSAALKLAVETGHPEHVDEYYRLFLDADSKTESLIRDVCAAQIFAGKAFLQAKNATRAVECFRKAAVTSGRKASVLREAILSLLSSDRGVDADYFLTLFPKQERESIDYLLLDYQVIAKIKPLHEVLRRGRELLKQGHAEAVIYKILIQACLQAGHDSEAESFALDASRRWPSQGTEYLALLQEPPIVG